MQKCNVMIEIILSCMVSYFVLNCSTIISAMTSKSHNMEKRSTLKTIKRFGKHVSTVWIL